MRGIYAAGVLDAFIEEGLYPSLAFGTSAGSLMTANFLTGDYQGAKRTVLAMAADKEFMAARNFVKTGGLFDFQYLFDVAPERLGFSKEKLMASPCRFYAVATELETGCSALFGKTDPDFWTGIAASCSIPLLCRPVEARGNHYLDGGVVSPIALREARRMQEGPLLVISTQARGYRKRARASRASVLMNRLFASYPKVIDYMRHSEKVYNAIFDELDSLNDSGDLLAIYPSKSIAIKATERDPEVLNAIYALGHADAKSEMKNILYFLSKTRTDRI